MFKKNEEGAIIDVTFLDFQIPLYTSPAFDLLYGFNCVGGREVREKKPEMIKVYHGFLVDFLKKFEFTGNIPSVVDIRMELLKMIGFGE